MESELRSRPTVSEVNEMEEPDVDLDVEAPTAEATVIPIGLVSEEEEEEEEEDNEPDESPAEDVAEIVEDDIEIVVTDTTPVAPTEDPILVDELGHAEDVAGSLEADPSDDDSSITDDREADSVRRSFYSRRSAKLPRIGVEAGRGAMAAAAGLRTSLTSDDSKKNSDPGRSQEYETV